MRGQNHDVKYAILRALKEIGSAAGAARIQQRLRADGIHLQPRTVRFYLLQLDREGLTRAVSRRSGRELTEQGRIELSRAKIPEKLRFIASQIDSLVYRMSYDLLAHSGTIVSNLALIRRDCLQAALEEMSRAFGKRLGMGTRLALAREGGTFGSITVPPGFVAIGTVCSVTANGILLKEGIPVTSRYGGLMEIKDGKPARFVALIDYNGTTLDPLEAFIRAGMTRVRDCVRTNNGVIGVSFREIPSAALEKVRRIKKAMEERGLDGILAIGVPNQPLFEVPVGEGRVGMIVNGGLNPVAALNEAGIDVQFRSLAEVEDIARFEDFTVLRERHRSAGVGVPP
ncbi:MAG: NrpR regulatory domain-containing protein [Verrucomicrobiae bacterium]|nr:NrpR regulatory domain-containing protein [Verrucomicrobiae bacterium]